MKELLKESEIEALSKNLPANWQVSGIQLQAQYDFDSVAQAKNFIGCVVDVSEKLDHHPDLQWSYKSVQISITTHEMNGLTELDFTFAVEVQKCLEE